MLLGDPFSSSIFGRVRGWLPRLIAKCQLLEDSRMQGESTSRVGWATRLDRSFLAFEPIRHSWQLAGSKKGKRKQRKRKGG